MNAGTIHPLYVSFLMLQDVGTDFDWIGQEHLVSERMSQRSDGTREIKTVEPESATESDEDEKDQPARGSHVSSAGPSGTPSRTLHGRSSPMLQAQAQDSDTESSPHRPAKKAKPAVSSDDDSEDGQLKSRSTSAAPTSGVKRTMRQPMKRGGKRF